MNYIIVRESTLVTEPDEEVVAMGRGKYCECQVGQLIAHLV